MEKITKEEKRCIIIGIIALIILTIFLSIKTENDVKECINDGVDKNICEELRRF